MDYILEVENLEVDLKRGKERISAVDNVGFSLKKGKTLGIIGESGSGKSLTCMGILGLLNQKQWDVSGDVKLNGEVLNYKNNKLMERVRGNKMALIMQNPMSAFNPVITIGSHFLETMRKPSSPNRTRQEVKQIAIELLQKMRIRDPEAILKSYAFQLSGGMLQRIMIALALAVEPDILIADEPTTALDLTVQHEIIKILKEMQEKYGTAILIVSHDLGVISHLSHEIAVMYAGNFVEKGESKEILSSPRHPYTKGLFASRPDFSKQRLVMMDGQPPTLDERTAGCRFAPRCPYKKAACQQYHPKGCSSHKSREVKCILEEGGD